MAVLGSILGPFMRWCYLLTKNYGMAIILFTLITKVILFPLSLWVQKNSIVMVKIQPALNRIKAKYFGDKDTIADEQSKLYKEEKYNPLASLIPLAIQIFLLMGVVEVIYHPLDYILKVPQPVVEKMVEVACANDEELIPEASSIQLAVVNDLQENKAPYEAIADAKEYIDDIENLHMSFLGFDLSWIASVEKGKAILVPIIAALSAWLLAFAQNKMNVLQTEQSTTSQWGMTAFSVILSLYLGSFVPAGVGLYWVASNIMAIGVQWICNKVMDPRKYVDYEALEESKKELKALEGDGKKKRKLFGDAEAKKEKQDYKRFMSIGNKHLVFYSESNGFYKYFQGYIEYLLKYTNVPIHYITSDPNDNIFKMAESEERILPYYIGSTKLITLMMKMDADIVVMTMPDLETYQIKRSYIRKDIEYINVQHGVGSVNLLYRKGALDHYDTIFVSSKSQKEEIRATEKVYNLPEKNIVEVGYPLLDDMRKAYAESEKKENKEKTILIAPSWQKDNIVDSCLEELLDNLKGHGYKIIVRPHPQHVRHMPEKMESLKAKYEPSGDVEIQTDFSSNSTVYEADVLVSDWSDIALEFALTTLKPVLFINTPMKVMNPEWEKIDVKPLNLQVRDLVGIQIETNNINSAITKIDELFEKKEQYSAQIEKLLNDQIYNLGNSRNVGGRYLALAVLKHIEEKANNE